MHQKVFLFSQAGSAQNIVMVGSNNMTRNNAENQWSDIYTSVGDPALYWTYAGVFDEMKKDVIQGRQFISARINNYQTDFYPNPSVVSQETDPVWNDLNQISCGTPAPGYGVSVPNPDGTVRQTTAVRISHHAWRRWPRAPAPRILRSCTAMSVPRTSCGARRVRCSWMRSALGTATRRSISPSA